MSSYTFFSIQGGIYNGKIRAKQLNCYCFGCFSGHRLAVLSNGALKFSRVTLGDAGTYQCLAQNEAGTAMGRTNLVLQGIL